MPAIEQGAELSPPHKDAIAMTTITKDQFYLALTHHLIESQATFLGMGMDDVVMSALMNLAPQIYRMGVDEDADRQIRQKAHVADQLLTEVFLSLPNRTDGEPEYSPEQDLIDNMPELTVKAEMKALLGEVLSIELSLAESMVLIGGIYLIGCIPHVDNRTKSILMEAAGSISLEIRQLSSWCAQYCDEIDRSMLIDPGFDASAVIPAFVNLEE